MAAQMTPRFRDLPDVDWASFADGEVPTYDTGTDTLTGEIPAAGGSTGAAGGVLSGTYPNPGFDEDMATQAELDSHNDDTSFVHGITNTADLATDAEVATAVSNHSADATSVHGITDTSVLATDTEVATAVLDHSAGTTLVHGVADTSVLATDAEVAAAVSAHESDTTVHGVDTANVPSTGQKSALAGTTGTPGGANRYVTETDPLLGAADLSDAVILEPADSDRNTIQPSVDAAALTLKGNAAQSVPVQMWADSDDEPVAWLSVNGRTFAVEIADGVDASGVYLTADSGTGTYIGVYGPDGGAADLANWLALWSDSTNRHEVTFDGAHKWSDGTAATDTTLERTGVGELSVNGEPVVLDDDARLVGGVDQGDIDTTVATHSADTTAVHGIADTSALASLPIAEANVTGLTAALAAKQPLDSDLTAIAALTTTSFGRSLLEEADASGAQTTLGVSTFIKTLLDDTTAAAARTTLGVTSGVAAPISGKYYGAVQGNTSVTAGSLVQSRAIYTPFWVDGATTFDRIGIEVGVGVASLVYRLGIYTYSATTGYPGALVLDAGTVDGASGGVKLATISQQPAAGWYYFVCVPQAVAIGAATLWQVNLFTSGGQYPIPQAGFRGDSMLYCNGVTGALPDPAAAVTVTTGYIPSVMLRVA